MIDVHPPHQPVHTWKDFLIHMSAICLGLLIAIGLEQVVEIIHHHNQVVEARKALRDEQTANEQLFARRTKSFRAETGKYQNNLAVLLFLQKHPGAPSAQWPGTVNWHSLGGRFNDSAWATIERSNVTDLLPQAEVRRADRLYKELAAEDATHAQLLDAIREARRYMVVDYDPSHLTPPQLAEAIALAENVLTVQYRLGTEMRNLNSEYPSFTPAPSTEELVDIMHEPHQLTALPTVTDTPR